MRYLAGVFERIVTPAAKALFANWTYALINVVGLALGLAAFSVILVYVRYETTYDHWLTDADQVYQVQTRGASNSSLGQAPSQATAFAVGVSLANEFPKIKALVHVQLGFPTIIYDGVARKISSPLFVDGPFFDVLDLPFVEGDRQTALAMPGSVVLTASEANKIFGAGRGIGQVLTLEAGDVRHDYKVTGIIRDLPPNTHLSIGMIARFDEKSPPPYLAVPVSAQDWGALGGFTYLKVKGRSDVDEIRAALPRWKERNVPPQFRQSDWQLVNVKDIHMGDAVSPVAARPNIDMSFIATFVAIAILVLVMACINFVNLATAYSTRRAREIALRKLAGASRAQIITQLLCETLVLTAIALVLALTIVELVLPRFSDLLGVAMSMSYNPELIILLIGLGVFVALCSGLYPAFYLSRFRPASVLRSNVSSSEGPGATRLRSALVIVQFAVSAGLIICTSIMYMQIAYVREIDPGFKRDGLLQIDNAWELGGAADRFAEQALRVPGVVADGRSALVLGNPRRMTMDITQPGMSEQLKVEGIAVDPGYLDTVAVKLLSGRMFDVARPGDDGTLPIPPDKQREAELAERGLNVIINETAVHQLGLGTPSHAIGRTLNFSVGAGQVSHVVGVVRNVRFGSARDKILPMIFYVDRGQLQTLVLRYQRSDLPSILGQLEERWNKLAPHTPMQARVVDEILEQLYRAEDVRGRVCAAFAVIAIVIACLGLFGLGAFSAERRTKEVGVRKVFGASRGDILRLLVWQFSRPVLIANVLAWPIAWIAMRDWLNGFDARIAMTPVPFLLATLLSLAIAIATIATYAINLARTSPAISLRHE